ncbi:MAG: rRNA maturation RNase YbeY [Methylococcaceae bacterium]|nr:rRNA maturation RNase YbeY [Methylococcaceae bacterium]
MSTIVDVQIACEGDVPNNEQFQQWVDAALQQVDEECELSIRLVEDEESAELNSTYRGKTGPTNVLSFPFDSPVPMEPRLLGDLIICTPKVEVEAKEQDKLLHHHWAHLVVHGCLHLLGYDHIEDEEAEIMEELEKQILQTLDIDNPYQEEMQS